MSRRRFVVEREVALNRAEVAFLRRAVLHVVGHVPCENEARWLVEALTDRIVTKLDRALQNWSAP